MSTESERAATRERVRRFRERRKQEKEQEIRDKFEHQSKSEEFKGRELFLRESATAVDILLEADSFLLWSLHPRESKALGVPLPQHISESNVDDAIAHLEAFAASYEKNPLKSLTNPWKHMLRLCLLDGIVLNYGDACVCSYSSLKEDSEHVCTPNIWIRISPGLRDLYRQYCKHLGKNLPTTFVKPAVVPEVPRKKVAELEDRFLTRMLSLDKGFALLPEGEGKVGQIITGGRARVVWELMSELDQQALAKKVQQEFASFCDTQGKSLPQEPPAEPTVAEGLVPKPEPTRVGDFVIGSFVQKRGGASTLFTITGFQNDSHAIVSFHDDDNNETVSGVVIPLSGLVVLERA